MNNMYKVTFFAVMLLMVGCSQKLTRQDVQDEITEAREEVQEAQEEVKDALQKREQFYSDYKEVEIEKLRARSKEIDSKIKNLKKMSDGSNQQAEADMESAVNELKKEQRVVEQKIDQVEQIQAEDWTQAYEEVDQAISNIEQQITQLEASLGKQGS